MPNPDDWLAARTQSRRESWAAENVARLGAEFYFPKTMEAERFLQGGVRHREFRVRPLFPTYLFVRPRDGQWHALLNAFGVVGLVLGAGGYPATIRESVIASIRRFEGADGIVTLPKEIDLNSKVTITRGAYTGFTGIVSSTPAKERCQVLLDFMGGKVKFLVPLSSLEAAA
jgi:transcription antitermination factor NusG